MRPYFIKHLATDALKYTPSRYQHLLLALLYHNSRGSYSRRALRKKLAKRIFYYEVHFCHYNLLDYNCFLHFKLRFLPHIKNEFERMG